MDGIFSQSQFILVYEMGQFMWVGQFMKVFVFSPRARLMEGQDLIDSEVVGQQLGTNSKGMNEQKRKER